MRYGRLAIALSICIAAALIGAAAWGQSATVVVDHPAGISRLFVEVPGTTGTNDAASRFQLRTIDGDPTTPNDDNRPIASVIAPFSGDVSAFSSITTISINNSNPQATDQVLADLSNIQDGGGREFWPLMPTARSRDIMYRMLVGIDDDPDQALEIIQVAHEAVLLRDTVKLDYILTNQGTQEHTVGLRIFIDCTFGMGNQDGTFIVVSDGTIVDTEQAFPGPSGGGVPDAWVSFDSVSAPDTVLRGTIKGGEVDDAGLATFSAGAPDAVEFGQRVNMGRDNQFNFTPNAAASIVGEDWGYAVRWDEEILPVGASRRYVTYYGLGGSASDFTPPYVLAAYAPFELQVIEGDDPITPGVIEDAYLADRTGNSTWEVRGFCDNFGAGSILDARATISLPAGFELDQSQGMQSRTILLGTIPRNVQASARWRVRATEDIQAGIHEIRVSGPLGRSVRRKISVPALPTLPQAHLDPLRGLSMVSVPYNFQITDAEHVFQSLGSLQGSDAALVRWETSARIYRFFPDNFVTNVQPGLGYWLVNRLRVPIVFPDPPDRQPIPTNRPFPIALAVGWTQLGSPFISTIRLDQVTVVGSDGIDRTIMEASAAGLIVPTLFAYDVALNDYTFSTKLSDAVLEPYVGYWILALRPVTLVVPPPTLIPFKANEPPAIAPEPEEGWRVPLIVSGGKLTRQGRAFGQSPGAADGPDLADIMSPPDAAAPDGARVGAYFLRNDWGPRSGRYYTDIRSARPGRQSWTFVVDTDMANESMTISWPELGRMPANLIATLEDVQTGRTRFMRTTHSHTFNSGRGGPRQFRVQVTERNQATLQIMGFNHARVAGGLQMSCTLSAAAAVDVIVRNIAGRVVKHVWKGRETPAGEASILWTGQADNGLRVPNGPYVVEIVAQSQETGERTGVLRTVRYHR